MTFGGFGKVGGVIHTGNTETHIQIAQETLMFDALEWRSIVEFRPAPPPLAYK